jgi:hypothetical protein
VSNPVAGGGDEYPRGFCMDARDTKICDAAPPVGRDIR